MQSNMIQRYFSFALLSVILCFLSARLNGQSVTDNPRYYEWFDSQVGLENTGLYQGILYREQYRTINDKTKVLGSPEFHEGSLIYDGEPYIGQQLKYDIFGDELLIKIEDRLGGNTLQLFKEHVSEFVIDNRPFVNIKNAGADSEIHGFYEVSFKNNGISLLTKHRKRVFSRKDRSSLYYEFTDGKKEYVLNYKSHLYPITGKKDLTNIFPDLEDQINSFYNQARTLRRNDPHAFMVGLVQRIGNLLPLD